MNFYKTTMASLAITMAAAGLGHAATVDTVDTGGYFVPTDAQKYDSPYYRGNGEDWNWTHNAIGGVITSASLLISAFDVDFGSLVSPPGEFDAIYADDNGVATFLGYLQGGNDIWAYTTFALGANFFDDIATGLKVSIVIDTGVQGWFVTLAKSVITTDGATPPPPPPGVPLPAGGLLLMGGLGGLAALRRRNKSL